MITLVLTPNVFEPVSRIVENRRHEPGLCLVDLIPKDWEAGEVMGYLNGMREEDLGHEVNDGDMVWLVAAATDIYTQIILAIVAIIIGTKMLAIPEEPPAINPNGSATYGYYGFSNSYRAEGDPIPVVYGKMRVAPPCVNQVIGAASATTLLGPASSESMYILLGVSEGPIEGLGDYRGPVENVADQDALVGNTGNARKGTGLQVNGIPGEGLAAGIDWRTGTGTQDALRGSQGYADYTDTAATYEINLTPGDGTDDIDEGSYPPGVYSYGSAGMIEEGISTEYSAIDIAVKADRCVVQIEFERGLFSTGSGGNPGQASKVVRVQYYETDASGTITGDVVLLPQFKVTHSISLPFVYDIPFDFLTPATYAPPMSLGFYRGSNSDQDWLKNDNDTAHAAMVPSNRNLITQKWSMAFWYKPRFLSNGAPSSHATVFSWTYPIGQNIQVGNAANGFQYSIGNGEAALGVHVWVDGKNFLNDGGGTKSMRLSLCTGVYQNQVHWHSGHLGNYDSAKWTKWQHLAITYDGTDAVLGSVAGVVTFWVDGIAVNSGPITHGQPKTNFPRWQINNAYLRLGVWQGNPSTDFSYASRTDMAEFLLIDRVLDWTEIKMLGGSTSGTDPWGNKNTGVKAFIGDPDARIILPQYPAEGSHYRNWALNPTGTPSNPAGDFEITDLAGVITTGGPVFSSTSGAGKRSYWHVETFVESPQTATSTSNQRAMIASLTALATQDFVYPYTAIASVWIQADSQVRDSQPALTLLVLGRQVNVWDGTLDANGAPAFSIAWTQNPAWIAADLITHNRYGMGAQFSSKDIDWPSFLEWARFCEEGVQDAFGSLEIFYLKAEGSAVVPTEELVTFYIGLVDAQDIVQQTIPATWSQRNTSTNEATAFISIKSVTSDGANGFFDQWITADDLVSGKNAASNLLDIYSIVSLEDTSQFGFHGWKDYIEVKARWKRLDASGDPIWPAGIVTGWEVYSDWWGLTSLADVSGFEERCHFDGIFDQQGVGGWDAVLQVFTAGRAMPVKAGQRIYAVVDGPREPVAVFGQGNIVEGSLTLDYLGPRERPNSIESEILDSQANYERTTILVDHSSIQNPTAFDSFRKETISLRGVVRRSQATRDTYFRLNRYNLIRRGCSFKVGPDAVNLIPGDRFRLSHDVPQYGYSGRLRGATPSYNTFPGVGSDLTTTWDFNGGNCTLSGSAFLATDATANPAGFTNYGPSVVVARSSVMASDGGTFALAGGASGADGSGAAPNYSGQHVATSTVLYPPNAVTAPLDQILDATYTCAFSVYVKEPALGASEYVSLNVFRPVDKDGGWLGTSCTATWQWTGGTPATTTVATGLTATTDTIGSGWFRIGVVYSAATAGATVGDYLQARTYFGDTSMSFMTLVQGGKGTNFLAWGDPLDSTRPEWTLNNDGLMNYIEGWGWDGYDQVTDIPSLGGATDVASGGYFGLAIFSDGSLRAWGQDTYGQVTDCPAGTDFTQVAAAFNTAYALKSDGSIVSWGSDNFGQVTDTPTGTGFTQIAGAWDTGAALKADGSIVAWGSDSNLQVTDVPAGTGYTQVAGGGLHLLALKADGSIVSWGYDFFDQVTDTPAGTGHTYIEGGQNFSTAITSTGSLVSWGRDAENEVTDTPTGTGFVQVALGWAWGCARKSAGTLHSWGANTYGSVSSTPSGSDYIDVAAGAYTGFARSGSGSTNSIANRTDLAPPFYTETDGTHGYVVRILKDDNIGVGVTPPNMVQTVTLATGSAVSTWNGERICFTMFFRVSAADTASNTSLYVDLRTADTLSAQGVLSGDGIGMIINMYGTPAISSTTKYEVSGTVANVASAMAFVTQNSSTADGDWYQLDASFDYTPSAGSLTAISVGIYVDGVLSGDSAVDIWGPRLHGGSLGSTSGVLVNPNYHRGSLFWGHQYEAGASSIGSYVTGGSVKLDRDVTLDAGNTYELLLRSSFEPDAAWPRDNQEVLVVDESQVPGSGSTTIAANTDITVSAATLFTPEEGDIYSFGETGVSSADFVVTKITLDPETMEREIEAQEYDVNVYDDTAFGDVARTTVSDLPPPGTAGDENAESGLGVGGRGMLPGSGLAFRAFAETLVKADGSTVTRISVTWRWPMGVRKPKALRIYIAPTSDAFSEAQEPPRSIGEAMVGAGAFVYEDEALLDGQEYDVFMQMIGWSGTAMPVSGCPRVSVVARLAPDSGRTDAPTVTSVIRGFEQVYTLAGPSVALTYGAVEGRIGGWVYGSPAFLIDPDTSMVATSKTLVGQASTATGDTGMRLFARTRTGTGFYGRLTEVEGTEQIADVGYTHSTSCEDNYASSGAVSTELAVTSNVIGWDGSSTALTATYVPDQITLTSASRVLVNCVVAGTQIRPETLADCTFELGDAVGSRWSLEGPMDNLAGDNSSVLIEWDWGSSSLSGTWRKFEPGIVYAKVIKFRVTFTRPTASYDMRITRVISQALTLPAFEAGDIDGGTF